MTHERAVKAEDIERYRRALTELDGEASLEQLAGHAGTGETDIGYIAACLIVPVSDRPVPFAVPSAWGRGGEGRRLWRTAQHCTPDDIEEARRFLGPLGGGASLRLQDPRDAFERYACAHHEAAHAVVGMRLGMSVVRTDIRVRAAKDPTGRPGLSVGRTAYADGVRQGWFATADHEMLRKDALQIAAGIVAEMTAGRGLNTEGDRVDQQQLVQNAHRLGLGNSPNVPAVEEFMRECISRAADILFHDEGAAWGRVTKALLREGMLDQPRLRELVERHEPEQ